MPAWNEEEALPGTIAELQETVPYVDLVVVNDGSTDNTSAVAREAGAFVIDLPYNMGVGAAMRTGYKYAQRTGYDYAMQVDSDGQHHPESIPSLIDAVQDYDIVIGSRFGEGSDDYEVSGPRKWAMNLFSVILSRVCETHLSDTTSGFKLYGPRALALFAHNYPAEYLGDTIGALVIAARSHLVVREVGVQMHPRAGGEPSHNPIKSALFLVRATMALAVSLSRPGEKVAQAPEENA